MPYRILRFDNVFLPDRIAHDDLSSGQVESPLVDSVGGTFDFFGSRARLPRRIEIVHQGRYLGAPLAWVTEGGALVVNEDDKAILFAASGSPRFQVDAIKALTGQRRRLWRQRDEDGALLWRNARLMHVHHIRKNEDVSRVADVELRFETDEPTWKVEPLLTPNVAVTAGLGNPAALLVDNVGSVAVLDARLRITRTSGTITQVNLANAMTGANVGWNGSIGAGGVLVIDTGLQTVRLNDGDAYGGFFLWPDHSTAGWFPLTTGPNACTFSTVGGNATVQVEYYAQWI